MNGTNKMNVKNNKGDVKNGNKNNGKGNNKGNGNKNKNKEVVKADTYETDSDTLPDNQIITDGYAPRKCRPTNPFSNDTLSADTTEEP